MSISYAVTSHNNCIMSAYSEVLLNLPSILTFTYWQAISVQNMCTIEPILLLTLM